jgi:hypothetical protein
MNIPPPIYSQARAPRLHLDTTPAVLRFPDGRQIASKLQVISCTGGLLALPQPLAQGSEVKVMFLAGGGSVLGGAELLNPITSTLQPFRFVSLPVSDRHKLAAIIQASSPQNNAEELWIEKLRAATSPRQDAPRRRFVKLAMGVAGFITLGLASVMYLFHFQLPK